MESHATLSGPPDGILQQLLFCAFMEQYGTICKHVQVAAIFLTYNDFALVFDATVSVDVTLPPGLDLHLNIESRLHQEGLVGCLEDTVL